MTPVEASLKMNANKVWRNLYLSNKNRPTKPKFFPPTYKIKDDKGKEIQGTFYDQELQKTTQEIFRLEKIIKTRDNKSLIKWLGYPDFTNSWVDKKKLI